MGNPVNVLVHSFNNGEASPSALNRIDKEVLRLFAERQENLIPYVVGKAMMRPGTQYIAATASNDRPELIPFESSDDDVPDAILVFTDSKMRVMISDAYVTRPSVTSTVTNGDFSSSTGWTLTVATGATGDINSSASGALYMACPARGSSVVCTRSVSTSSAGTLHALRIEVTRGPVRFRCGETAGGEDYVADISLETGTHSLAFTPSGTYHVWFRSERETAVIVNSVTVESAGTLEVTTPWAEADLPFIRTAQSKDVLFVASGHQQRRIERHGDGENSWSLVYYKVDNGPFRTARSADVRLKPAATYGNTTLTASADFFLPEHVGSLFKLTHQKMTASWQLAGEGKFTDTWKITGIKHDIDNDRVFSYVTTGTWVGSITMERSDQGPDEGFHDTGYDNGASDPDFTTNQSISHIGSTTENNATYWYRMGFQPAEYTSGSVLITVSTGIPTVSYGVCRVVGYVSPTEVSIEVLNNFKNTEYTENWRSSEWSDIYGWPTAVEFHDGRLFWSRGEAYWGSESDNYHSFDAEVEGDARTIARTITLNASSIVRWMLSLQRLIFGTKSGEISARSDAFDAPLTATNITLKTCSTQGSANVPPTRIDSRGLYVQRGGRKIYELAYDVQLNDYASNNMMRINEDVALSEWIDAGAGEGSITRIAVQRQPDTHVWARREDGVCPVLLYEPDEKVRGWWRFVTGNVSPGGNAPWDRVISMAMLPTDGEDTVYFAIERDINGTSTYSIEKLRFHSEAMQREYDDGAAEIIVRNGLYMADCFATATGTSVSAQVISGYSHLVGREVIVIGQRVGGTYGPLLDSDGELELLTVNGSGQVTLPVGVAMSGTLCIGLPYRGRYRSSKLAYGTEGTALLQKKKVHEIGLALLNTHPDAIRIGRNFTADEMDELPRIDADGAERAADNDGTLEKEIDEATFTFPGEWDTDGRVCVEVRPGFSATLSALVMAIEGNEG